MILVLNIFWKFKTRMMILILNKCHYYENDHQKEGVQGEAQQEAQGEAQGEVQNQ